MARETKTKLRHVAEMAGVSLTTASMILNEKPGVKFSEETITRVKAHAQRLGYAPVQAPPRDVSLFHHRVVVIFSATITGDYYTSLVQAIEKAAQLKGFHTVCYQSYHSAARELEGLTLFSRTDIAGIIFTYIPHQYKMLETLVPRIPAVIIGDHDDALRIDMVETNNYAAGTLMARHVLGLGHRRVAFLNDRREWQGYPSTNRLRGVQAMIEREEGAELTVFTSRARGELELGDGGYMARAQTGYGLAETCMAQRPDVTAILCVTDILAYGVLDYLRGQHLRVPEDYSVCGFDNNFAAGLLGLTTHDHHVHEIGVKAFEMLYVKMRSTGTDKPEMITKTELIGEIVVRASTGTPRDIDILK